MAPRFGVPGPTRSAGLVGSFRHALRGVAEVAACERNMKIHLCAGAAIGLAGSEVAFGLAARLALLLSVALVLAAEVLNSALEALVDLHTQEFRHEARRVKDAAAGVVLLLAAGAVMTGTAVLAVSWGAMLAAARGLGAAAGWDLVVLASVATLLFGRMPRTAAAVVGFVGAAALAVVAVRSVSLTFTALATGMLAIGVSARWLAPLPDPLPAARGEGAGPDRGARVPAPLPGPLPAARGEGVGPNRDRRVSDPLPSGERAGRGG